VTTQNTHHEQNDVETTVVESLSASEQGNDAATAEGIHSAPAESVQTDAETTPHTSAEVEAGASIPEPTTPATASEEKSGTISPDVQSEPAAQKQQSSIDQTPASSSPEVTQEEASYSNDGYNTSIPVPPLHDIEAEVRPFAAFIEEFHQAEARFNASLQGPEAEVFYAFPTVPPIEATLEEVREEMQASLQESSLPSSSEADKQGEEGTATRRPSSTRSRTSRQGASRGHHRATGGEHATTHTKADASSDTTAAAEEKSTLNVATPVGESSSVVKTEEASLPADSGVSTPTEAEQETPRPARRYRFDGRATVNSATTAQNASPTHKENRRQTNGDLATDTSDKAATPVTPAVEQHNGKQATAQETRPAENASAPAQEHGNGRRRHERSSSSKEQAAASTQVEPPTVPETPGEEIAPEDLPPLEYADLQKASSRRRRRHRSGSSSRAAAASVQNTPLPDTNEPTHLTSTEPPTQYTIVSGYTVGQMNQGNENKSPFMGPEPSPARGSLITRDVRGNNNRANMQRMPAPTFTPRTNEGGLSSPAINQLATAFSQAVQTQTDRLVAEFRHAAQVPTNISVSLPPFPSNERVGVFVDVANLLYSARTLRMGIDFGKLLDFLRGNRRLVRAHAYCPTSPQPGDEQMFLQAVKGLGYRITTKNYKTFSSGAKKADLDLDLCMDVVRLVDGHSVDCVVLVSGDSDFMPMLDYCSDHGVRVEVAAFDEAMSATLRQGCDLFINLSMLGDVLIHS
jgi:uncharacterized LabA/DUF88 family protein